MKPKKVFFYFAAVAITYLLFGQAVESQDTGILRAGLAKIDITPDLPVLLYGYSSRKNLSEGIHDHLYARAVVFENGGKKIVLVSSDLGSYSDTLYSVFQKSILEKFHLKESELFLSAIHSHSSPVVSLDKNEVNINNIQYTNILNQRLLTVIGDAINNLKPVNTGAGVGYSPVGSNRREMTSDGSITLGRNPYGPTDKEVLVMKIATPDGAPLGAIYDYATHATSLGPDNMIVSGDVLGISEQFVEKILGKEVVSPMFAGASGDIDPWYRILPKFDTEAGWIPEPVLLGTLLGEEVVHVFRDIKKVVPGGVVNSSFITMECPRKSEDEKGNKIDDQGRKATVPVKITVARIGEDVAFVGFNVEMLTEIGMAIKEGSPFKHTFIITHCNGDSGYLPPAYLYKEGGYEVSSTDFQIGSADMVVKKTLRMLYDLK